MTKKPGQYSKAYPGEAALRRMYVDERKSTREIARECGSAATTVGAWLRGHGVQMRSVADAKRGQKPKAHTVEASVRARRKTFIKGRGTVGYKVDGYGYILLWNAGAQRYEKEHRVIMEKHLGRKLKRGEDVHHINENRQDNRIENLVVVAHADHLREHYGARSIDKKTGRFLTK